MTEKGKREKGKGKRHKAKGTRDKGKRLRPERGAQSPSESVGVGPHAQ